jgi:hypothetical protein
LLLQLEDESSAMSRMGYLDDSDDDSLRDPFESQPLMSQLRNSDAAIDFAQDMLDEEEEERRENEMKGRKQSAASVFDGLTSTSPTLFRGTGPDEGPQRFPSTESVAAECHDGRVRAQGRFPAGAHTNLTKSAQ